MPLKKVAQTVLDTSPAASANAGQAVGATHTLLAPPSPTPTVGAVAAPAPLTSGPPDVRERILDAVVARVLSTLNVDGLARELTTKLAEEMLGQVRVDALVTRILEGQTEALTSRLTERLIAQILGLDQ